MKNWVFKKLTILTLFSAFVLQAFASSVACDDLFYPSPLLQGYKNFVIGQRFELKDMIADPALYISELRARFNAQKEKTPKNPREFEAYDLAKYSLQYMHDKIPERIAQLEESLKDLEKGKSIGFLKGWVNWFYAGKGNRIPFTLRQGRISEVRDIITMLKLLQEESAGYLQNKKVSYQKWLEFTHYWGRAIGYFKIFENNARDQALIHVDRVTQGYSPLPPKRELERYKNREFWITQDENAKHYTFGKVNPLLDDSFHNPDELEFALIPIVENPGYNGLQALIGHEIYPIGITSERVYADGFGRPGGDFYNHDLRHAALLWALRKSYLKTYNLKEGSPEVLKLGRLQEELDAEFNTAITEQFQGKNEKMYQALKFYYFNLHHKHGLAILPSTYALGPVQLNFAKGFWAFLKMTGQNPKIGWRPWKRLNEAHEWATKFFMDRADRELSILKRDNFLDHFRKPFFEDPQYSAQRSLRPLNVSELDQQMRSLPDWSVENGKITRSIKFNSHADAIEFVKRISSHAERSNHHPKITNEYSTVSLEIDTLDAPGGRAITSQDVNFARATNSVIKSMGNKLRNN